MTRHKDGMESPMTVHEYSKGEEGRWSWLLPCSYPEAILSFYSNVGTIRSETFFKFKLLLQ